MMARRALDALPPKWATSRVVESAKGVIRPWRRGDTMPTQRVVRTIAELDEMLAAIDEAAQVSDDQLRLGFSSFRMELDMPMPSDPYSDEYRIAVMELYEWLHGSPYQLINEHTDFEFDRFVDTPFPFSTHSCATVGNHLMVVGHVVKTLDLPPGSRILELGPGWGNTTLALTQMGHSVTAIDMSPEFLDLIRARAAHFHGHVETIEGDFSIVKELIERWDAVLFFESFHHSTDHLELLAQLHHIIAPGGKVLFASEPIEEEFYTPWGPRLDGESLWAIRRNGWFELGFQTSYFLGALRRTGWSATEVDHKGLTPCTTFVATESSTGIPHS